MQPASLASCLLSLPILLLLPRDPLAILASRNQHNKTFKLLELLESGPPQNNKTFKPTSDHSLQANDTKEVVVMLPLPQYSSTTATALQSPQAKLFVLTHGKLLLSESSWFLWPSFTLRRVWKHQLGGPNFYHNFPCSICTTTAKGDGHQGFGWDSDFEIRSLTSIYFQNVCSLGKWPIFFIILKFLFFLKVHSKVKVPLIQR